MFIKLFTEKEFVLKYFKKEKLESIYQLLKNNSTQQNHCFASRICGVHFYNDTIKIFS